MNYFAHLKKLLYSLNDLCVYIYIYIYTHIYLEERVLVKKMFTKVIKTSLPLRAWFKNRVQVEIHGLSDKKSSRRTGQ